MPVLHWVGKDKVVNHHYDVPFRLLKKQYRFQAKDGLPKNSTNNRIIHGDNLEALKSLLPEFEGKINCIYIDPPYNTGNEGWVYNDSVNDPKIKKWLGEVVGKEGEDLSRHDKWLCMMYPRLKLLHRLLKDDGIIFISIGDDELAHLRIVLNEIFGVNNFIAQLIWRRRTSSALSENNVSTDHEYVLIYRKNKSVNFLGFEKDFKAYSNPDNDPRGDWTLGDLTVGMNATMRPNQAYDLTDPDTGNIFKFNPNRVWAYAPDSMEKLLREKRVFFPKDINKRPMLKRFKMELKNTFNPLSSIIIDKVGLNTEATKIIQEIFDKNIFNYSKPLSLINLLVSQITMPNSIVLDSFAGSATTAHAVLKLNAEDGGNRRFICIEMMDYAETITAERVRSVINGYGEGSKAVSGLGGGFDFYTVDAPLFLEGNNLNEAVGVELIRNYVAYTERLEYSHRKIADKNIPPYGLGLKDNALYVFYYERDRITTLDMAFLGELPIQSLPNRPEQYIIYADKCALEKDFMLKHGITFKRIPRDISRF